MRASLPSWLGRIRLIVFKKSWREIEKKNKNMKSLNPNFRITWTKLGSSSNLKFTAPEKRVPIYIWIIQNVILKRKLSIPRDKLKTCSVRIFGRKRRTNFNQKSLRKECFIYQY